MFDEQLRGCKDRVISPLLWLTVRLRISPTAVTVYGLMTGLAAAVVAGAGLWGVALILWILNRVLDGVDGALARRTGRCGDTGGYLDILADFAVYAALPLGIAVGADGHDPTASVVPIESVWPAVAVLLASCYVNAASWMYLAAVLEKRAAVEHNEPASARRTAVVMPKGIVEGAETIAFYTAALLVPRHAALLFWILAALVLLTAVQRLSWWLRSAAGSRRSSGLPV